MMAMKKGGKSKFLPDEDMLNESQFIKSSPKVKKIPKRQRNEVVEDEDELTKLIGQYQASAKKKKLDVNIEACKESRQKILDVMCHQLESRKERSDSLLNSLSEIVSHLEADCNAMKENEKKLEHLTGAVIKCMQQATNAHKQKLKALKDIHDTYKKQVEGLITRGALKPDDRPLWFDVYRTFPPISEPKFSKPKPEIKPIRPILYPEDVIRAKFHSKGYGIGVTNMLSKTAETQTKRLVQQYEKLKSEGVPEEELVDKSVAAVGSERQQQIETSKFKMTPKNPDSVTGQVLADVDLKNIFKDKEN